MLTEETQQGAFFLEELGRKHPGALYRYHQEWVERLAQAAEAEVANKAARRRHLETRACRNALASPERNS